VFDPVLKQLADRHGPAIVGWFQRALGLPTGGPIEVVQPNLPAVTVDADRVYRIEGPTPLLLHTEWESSSALGRPDRFLVYNTLLTRQTELPVQTVVVLLRKEAHSSDLTGMLTRKLANGVEYLTWRYFVIRLWELPPAQFLINPGLTPLAPLSAVGESELPSLAQKIQAAWKGLSEPELKELKTATETLMGLRYPKELVHQLFGEVSAMEESVIYQEIYQKGRAEGLRSARQALIGVGKKHLGVPDSAQRKAIEQCEDFDRLERMIVNAVDAPDWATVLATA
jgi:hypothetical protein